MKQHLGGVVMSGWRTDGEMGRHAALLFSVAGSLYVADYGKVTPIAEYPFICEGFYEPDGD